MLYRDNLWFCRVVKCDLWDQLQSARTVKVYTTFSVCLSLSSGKLFPLIHFLYRVYPKQKIAVLWNKREVGSDHTPSAYRGSWCIAALILNLGVNWWWVVNFTSRSPYPREITTEPIEQEAGWVTESVWVFGEEKICFHLSEFEPQNVQRLAGRCFDYDLPTPYTMLVIGTNLCYDYSYIAVISIWCQQKLESLILAFFLAPQRNWCLDRLTVDVSWPHTHTHTHTYTHTHTHTHTRTQRTAPNEWSVRRRGLYLHNAQRTQDEYPCSQRDSNQRFQQSSYCRPTPLTARPLGSASRII